MSDPEREAGLTGEWVAQAHRAARKFSAAIDADAFIARLRARLRTSRRWRIFALWALVALTASLSGILSAQIMTVAVRALHLTAIAVWFGGVATLLLMALMREVEPTAREALRSALDPLTYGAFGVILGSGVILTAQAAAAGAGPEYLAMVGLKVAVVAALLVLAPRISEPDFRRRALVTRGGALAVAAAEFPLISSLALGVLAVLLTELLQLRI